MALNVSNIVSPMGWFYKVELARAAGTPAVYRCKIGQVWEKPEIYDIGEMTPDELRFLADLIEEADRQAYLFLGES